ncbi:MAG TPA: hypothetical protein VG722_06970 [Tepidisphaeraceae bacterium]|nr:hypothetical protein [Tepidisphaeraceae bacterium]
MQFDPVQIVCVALWSLPIWMKLVLLLAVLMRLKSPLPLGERATFPRRWYRRRRRYNWYD